MTLPAATLKLDASRPEGVALHYAETEGVPDGGLNIIGIPFVAAGINPDEITPGFIHFASRPTTNPSAPSVTGFTTAVHPTPCEPGSYLSADKTQIALEFFQSGVDEVVLTLWMTKTEDK